MLQKVKHQSIECLTCMSTYILLCKNYEMGEQKIKTCSFLDGGTESIGSKYCVLGTMGRRQRTAVFWHGSPANDM